MAIGQIYLNEEEEKIVQKYVKLWNIPKYEAIRKIIEEFEKLKGEIKKDVQEKEEGHTDN